MEEVFKSKVDFWLIGLVYVIIFASFYPLFTTEFSWIGFGILLATLLFVSIVLFGIRYKLSEGCLRISCASITLDSCKIGEITEITATRTILAAPASSLDRIKIKCGRKEIVISPERKAEFVEQLLQINSNIKVSL